MNINVEIKKNKKKIELLRERNKKQSLSLF